VVFSKYSGADFSLIQNKATIPLVQLVLRIQLFMGVRMVLKVRQPKSSSMSRFGGETSRWWRQGVWGGVSPPQQGGLGVPPVGKVWEIYVKMVHFGALVHFGVQIIDETYRTDENQIIAFITKSVRLNLMIVHSLFFWLGATLIDQIQFHKTRWKVFKWAINDVCIAHRALVTDGQTDGRIGHSDSRNIAEQCSSKIYDS